MKLHAALVLNMTYEPRGDTLLAQWTWQGFQRQSELNSFFSASNPERKITLYRAKLRRNYN